LQYPEQFTVISRSLASGAAGGAAGGGVPTGV